MKPGKAWKRWRKCSASRHFCCENRKWRLVFLLDFVYSFFAVFCTGKIHMLISWSVFMFTFYDHHTSSSIMFVFCECFSFEIVLIWVNKTTRPGRFIHSIISYIQIIINYILYQSCLSLSAMQLHGLAWLHILKLPFISSFSLIMHRIKIKRRLHRSINNLIK